MVKDRRCPKSLGNIADPGTCSTQQSARIPSAGICIPQARRDKNRFSSELVSEVVRDFTLTLWNVYSFFVTYANLDEPALASRTWSENLLDRWLLSELNVLVRDVTVAYENYDVPNATRPIAAFVEKLSTWYLRRSRRRFWKSESDSDKQAAYQTLYTALVTVAKLLSPSMPFLAEELYQNLVRSVDQFAPESVALAEWPEYTEAFIDEDLNRDMALVTKLVSLGHSARQKANRKVRQPLAEAAFSVGNPVDAKAVKAFTDLIEDELNVKTVRLLNASTEAVSHAVKPLPKQLGQKYGNRFPAIQKAILGMNTEEVAQTLHAGEALNVTVDGQEYAILPGEVEVKAQAREGFAVAEEGAYVAALVTELTPELVAEGLAREFVRRVQDLRKSADLDVADRITLFVEASAGLKSAVEAHRDYITGETLAVDLKFEQPPESSFKLEDHFDEEKVVFGLVKA
jgi:isoleucyl-tRNA synthetase